MDIHGNLCVRACAAGACALVMASSLSAEQLPFWRTGTDAENAALMKREAAQSCTVTFSEFNSWDWWLSSVTFPIFNSTKIGFTLLVR